jgi:hypothetical protein
MKMKSDSPPWPAKSDKWIALHPSHTQSPRPPYTAPVPGKAQEMHCFAPRTHRLACYRFRRLLLARAIVGTLLVCWGLLPRPSPVFGQKSPEKETADLIKALGSVNFADRERADEALRRMGAEAIEPLRRAVRGPDLETSGRAQKVLAAIELRVRMSPTKLVHLKLSDASIPQAVGELASQSGYSLYLFDPDMRLQAGNVTLDTGKVTFWEAFDKLCFKAGLTMLELRFEPVAPPRDANRNAIRFQELDLHFTRTQRGRPATGEIILVPGKLQPFPTCYQGPFRLRLLSLEEVAHLRPSAGAASERTLVLEVVAEPQLGFCCISGPVRVRAAPVRAGQVSIIAAEPQDRLTTPIVGYNPLLVDRRVLRFAGPPRALNDRA